MGRRPKRVRYGPMQFRVVSPWTTISPSVVVCFILCHNYNICFWIWKYVGIFRCVLWRKGSFRSWTKITHYNFRDRQYGECFCLIGWKFRLGIDPEQCNSRFNLIFNLQQCLGSNGYHDNLKLCPLHKQPNFSHIAYYTVIHLRYFYQALPLDK